MKFEFLGFYASIWACLGHLDGGRASEIFKKFNFGLYKVDLKNLQPQKCQNYQILQSAYSPPQKKSIYFEFHMPFHHPIALKIPKLIP